MLFDFGIKSEYNTMENYIKKATSTEKEIEDAVNNARLELDESLALDANIIHMNVKLGSKVANLMAFANSKFEVCTNRILNHIIYLNSLLE